MSMISGNFSLKAMQMQCVEMFIKGKGLVPEDHINHEINWFFNNLGIDESYFITEPVEAVASHIMMLYSAKLAATIKNQDDLHVNLKQELEARGLYIVTSLPGSIVAHHQVERRIDERYLDSPECIKEPFRVECYLSSGAASAESKNHIRCYFVNKCKFSIPNPDEEESRDIAKVSDEGFFKKAGAKTIQAFQMMMTRVLDSSGPVIESDRSDSTGCHKLFIAYRRGTTEKFFAALTDLYHSYGFYSIKKYVENLSNGVTFLICYLTPREDIQMTPQNAMSQILKEISMLYTLPNSLMHDYFVEAKLTAQEMVYGSAALVFAQHFLNRLGREYWSINEVLDPADPRHQQVLNKLKRRLRSETFTSEYILDIAKRYPALIKTLYVHFAVKHYVKPKRESIFSVAFISLKKGAILDEDEISDLIKTTVTNEHEKMVFNAFLMFNKSVMKNNFYNPNKTALAFKLNPEFLPKEEYPLIPIGMFLVIGNEFRGFHIRFQDIARGGIRIIRSRNQEIYNFNKRSLFDENYALASTQNRKNKDIPEGGSKGTILLNSNRQDFSRVAFEKYIDSLLDLLLDQPKKRTSGKGGPAVNPEILFFGPDEGTADYMDWASQYAKKRGLSYWKAITTGKSPSIGGIPHDTYGMTTRSVHRYVAGIYQKLGLKEEEVTKLQTGGPDGDLGSNEILISKDKTIGIVDGSGVVSDPDGLDRAEISRLAKERKMISDYDTSKLGPDGFCVLVDENDITLKDGTMIRNGLEFRNNFHLNPLSTADLFVPCGGRPEAVDISNYHELLWEDGTPRFSFIVEGANLFFTQEARIRLEKAGCIIFKDASANKGGVTSSSLEVLAALAMKDDDFAECMTVQNEKIPQFYQDYVKAVHKIIEDNADLEFECIWREKEKHPEKTRSEISDELSLAIIALKMQLQLDSTLWESPTLRRAVLSEMFPAVLQEKVGGLDNLISVLPDNYLRAAFATYMASRFVYKCGPKPRQLAFFEHVSNFARTVREKMDNPK